MFFADPDPANNVAGHERAVSAAEAQAKVTERIIARLGEGAPKAGRHRHTRPVTQPRSIIARRQTILSGDPNFNHPLLLNESLNPSIDVSARIRPNGQVEPTERAEDAKMIVKFVGVASQTSVAEPLQLQLDVSEHRWIEKLPQLLLNEQIRQQLAVEGQQRGTTLPQRRVPLVHVDRNPGEQQRTREW